MAAASLAAIRNSGRASVEVEEQSLTQKMPSEDLIKFDLVLGTLLVGYDEFFNFDRCTYRLLSCTTETQKLAQSTSCHYRRQDSLFQRRRRRDGGQYSAERS